MGIAQPFAHSARVSGGVPPPRQRLEPDCEEAIPLYAPPQPRQRIYRQGGGSEIHEPELGGLNGVEAESSREREEQPVLHDEAHQRGTSDDGGGSHDRLNDGGGFAAEESGKKDQADSAI